ncbi:excalibur calcium-binding domain-containing protein [Nostoc sp. CHAB 5834]|nr:excalibur calcium-binding domain-containing protein [Nostoc sp. CHAB 5834]
MTEEEIAARDAVEQSVYYEGCNEVRAAGKAPLYRGNPGYGEHMDGDGDGVACEPYY